MFGFCYHTNLYCECKKSDSISDKSGAEPSCANEICDFIRDKCQHLELAGVMTIGDFTHTADTRDEDNPDFLVSCFLCP